MTSLIAGWKPWPIDRAFARGEAGTYEICVPAEQYDAFVKVLESPPAPNEKLKALMANKSPWET